MRKPIVLAAVAVAAAAVAAAQPATSAPRPPAVRFVTHTSPPTMGLRAGEPTLGVDEKTGAVLFQASTQTLRVTNMRGDGGATWEKTPVPAQVSLVTLDPILETDRVTNRSFVSQLDGVCSRGAYSDDDGRTWTPMALGCAPGAVFDHQSVGTGPFVAGGVLRPATAYPHAVYYCAHDLNRASCGTSVDGGLTFGPAIPAYTTLTCTTNFGHLKSAPDGTIYLPPRDCGSGMGLAVSEDNGLTWRVSEIDGSTAGNAGHPSVGVGSDGTVYMGWGGGDGAPYAAVSRDKGESWTPPVRLGREFGITNTKFVVAAAGDGDRAAIGYLGTRTDGNDQAGDFAGVWHLYVSYTYDRGATWHTYDATPSNPVQIGSICTAGISCGGDRNLLDFNDMVVDKRGMVLVAFADGCTVATIYCDGSREKRASIARQTAGRGLYRAYDR